MRTIHNPLQTALFDPLSHLPDAHRRSFMESPEGVIRAAVLEVLPVNDLAEKFCADTGAPTKELYSMAGLVLMMEYKDWTVKEAVNEYMWNHKIQLALNINGQYPEICERTLYRYIRLFAEDNGSLSDKVMERVTMALIELGELDISKQRLDSTHVFSNMAVFGRTRMMGVTVKRFLTQVIRHDKDAYEALAPELRERYKASQGKLFADTAKSKDRDRHVLLRQTVAEDMHSLIGTFEVHSKLSNADSFKALVRVFHEQCKLTGDAVEVREKTGSRVMQNPSDPDATYDGHKGPGYQAQITETCSEENDVQLITSVATETAADSDMEAVEPVLDDLEQKGLLPESMQCDAGYGSDSNVMKAEEKGVELVSPTRENAAPETIDREAAAKLSLDDFVFNEETEEVLSCPAGHTPVISVHDEETGKTRTVMPKGACTACSHSGECLVQRKGEDFQLEHTAKQRRLDERRREEATEAFAERYRKRAGIESTNSGIKQTTGLGQLRVRGLPRVASAIALKAAGWNILRASACAKIQEFVKSRLSGGLVCTIRGRFRRIYDLQGLLQSFMPNLGVKPAA
ncbi:MAG: transposase [Planctomycetota bacterium]|jgi:hypothetical protein